MNRTVNAALIALVLFISGCTSPSPPDMDNDGISDEEDQDIDGDGFNNTLEINCNSDPQKNTSTPSDIDNDGICDTVDLDIDGDGLPNDWEEERGFDPRDAESKITCHGRSEYCLRTYDDFTFAEAHNAYSTPEDGVLAGINHLTGLQSQWEGGIRSFMLDPHHQMGSENEKEDVVFCHGLAVLDIHPCLFGSVDAFSWLRTLNYLHNNSSGDVVSFLFENQIPGDHL